LEEDFEEETFGENFEEEIGEFEEIGDIEEVGDEVEAEEYVEKLLLKLSQACNIETT